MILPVLQTPHLRTISVPHNWGTCAHPVPVTLTQLPGSTESSPCFQSVPLSPTWDAVRWLSLVVAGPLLWDSVEHEALEEVSSRDTERDGPSVRHRSRCHGLRWTSFDTYHHCHHSQCLLHWTHNFLRLLYPPAPLLPAQTDSETTARHPSEGANRTGMASLPASLKAYTNQQGWIFSGYSSSASFFSPSLFLSLMQKGILKCIWAHSGTEVIWTTRTLHRHLLNK